MPSNKIGSIPPLSPAADMRPERKSVEIGDENPLGGAIEVDLVAAVRGSIGEKPELDVPENGIAIQSIAKAIGARIRNADYAMDEKKIAIFVIADRPRALAERYKAKREPIVNNGAVSLTASLWISGPAFVSAYHLAMKKDTTAEIFDEVEGLGLGTAPAFVFDPNGTDLELRFYPNGMSDADEVSSFLIAEQTFSIDALDRVITRFYETAIRTPDSKLGDEGPWLNAKKYIPRPNAESFLQNWLKIAINSYFQHPYVCEFEKPGNEGRCDLMLVSKMDSDPNSFTHHAVLELKVLRSRTSTNLSVTEKARQEALSGGLDQAIAYKNEQSAENAMLCCFDMRNKGHCDHDECFSSIRIKAETHDIKLRRYRLYGSSSEYRADQYSGTSGTA